MENGDIENCRLHLKTAADHIISLPEEDQFSLISEFETIKFTFFRILTLEKIMESYKKDPVLTKKYEDLLKDNRKNRLKKIFKHIQTTLH
jgi:hypothetical protein